MSKRHSQSAMEYPLRYIEYIEGTFDAVYLCDQLIDDDKTRFCKEIARARMMVMRNEKITIKFPSEQYPFAELIRASIVIACNDPHNHTACTVLSPDLHVNDRKIVKAKLKVIFEDYAFGFNSPFSNSSEHSVRTDKGTFRTAEAAFQACKTDDEYEIELLRRAYDANEAREIGKQITLRYDWDNVKLECMERILRYKFDQHSDLRATLLATGLKPLCAMMRRNKYWGCTPDGSGKNEFGRILTKLKLALLADH